jgi:3-hydroxy-3-methylglutaryl CoA synthase
VNTETIGSTAKAIYEYIVANDTSGNLVEVKPIGLIVASLARRPDGGESVFLFSYGDGKIEGRYWAIEFDARTSNVIRMNGDIDDLDNHTKLLSDLAKFRIFHQ